MSLEVERERAAALFQSVPYELLDPCFVRPNYLRETVGASPYRERLSEARRTILVAAFPRSASTFTTQVLAALFGLRVVTLSFARGRSEHDLYVPRVLASMFSLVVAQHHLRATEANPAVIGALGIEVVVLVRSLEDVLLSLLQVVRSGQGTYVVDDSASTHGEERLLDYLIEYRLPWYFDFYLLWAHAIRQNEVPAQIYRFESLMSDPTAHFSEMSQALGSPAEVSAVDRAIEHVRRRAGTGFRRRLRTRRVAPCRRRNGIEYRPWRTPIVRCTLGSARIRFGVPLRLPLPPRRSPASGLDAGRGGCIVFAFLSHGRTPGEAAIDFRAAGGVRGSVVSAEARGDRVRRGAEARQS